MRDTLKHILYCANLFLKVPEDVIQEITNATKQQVIVHGLPTKKSIFRELEARLIKSLIGGTDAPWYGGNGKHKKKSKTFNIQEAEPDFENCNGWSVTVDQWSLPSLRGSNFGVFMVNLTKVTNIHKFVLILLLYHKIWNTIKFGVKMKITSHHTVLASPLISFLSGLDDGAALESNGY